MTAGRLARLEADTVDPNTGWLSRLEAVAPDPWYGQLSRLSATVPIALAANAGVDQTGLEPYHTYTLTGTWTGGTATGHSWRQLSGPTAAMTNKTQAVASFKAPGTLAGVTIVFGYIVTGTNGVPSVEDTVACTILPVTERIVLNGVLVPLEMRSVISSGSA